MSDSGIINTGIWYGKILSQTKEELYEKLESVKEEREKLFTIIDLLKIGEFKAKKALIDLMNTTSDFGVLNLCVRVFCAVATHEDLRCCNNLKFLEDGYEEGVDTFVVHASRACSHEVVPYLLALLDEWEDTEVELHIRDALEYILGTSCGEFESSSVDEIGERYLRYTKNIDHKAYYYETEPTFVGGLTKVLSERCFIATKNKGMLEMGIIPSILSIWSGIECPVNYHTIMGEKELSEVIKYIEQLIKMNFKKGKKYFYGHVVI